MIHALFTAFDSMTKVLEVLYVIENIKPVARIAVSEDVICSITRCCEKNNLAYSMSDFKVRMDFNAEYSTKGSIIPKNSGEKAHFFVYISKEKEKAEKAKELEAKNDHMEFGKILGYPECCCSFFVENREEEEKKHNDYVIPAIKNSKGNSFPFYMNIFGRYFDATLLNHCPCSFDCKASLALAKKHFNIIKRYDKNLTAGFEDILKSEVFYYGGNVLLKTKNNTILSTTKENRLKNPHKLLFE